MCCNVIPVMLIANTVTYCPLFLHSLLGEFCPVQDHYFIGSYYGRSSVLQKVRCLLAQSQNHF